MAKKKNESKKRTYALNLSYLKRIIKQRNMTQQALAKQVPCSSVMIHRWITGKSQITARKLVDLSKALNVDACTLIQTDDERAIMYLRDLLNRRIEHDLDLMRSDDENEDIPLMDHSTILQIIKTLGYDRAKDVKVSFNPDDFNFQRLQSESQMDNLLDIDNDA